MSQAKNVEEKNNTDFYCKHNKTHTQSPPLPPKQTHINGVPLEDAELQEELQFDLPLLEQLLHLGLGLVQLLQDALDMVDGAVVWGLVAGDCRVSATETHNLAISTERQRRALKKKHGNKDTVGHSAKQIYLL